VRCEGKGLFGAVHIYLKYNKRDLITIARMCSGCIWLGYGSVLVLTDTIMNLKSRQFSSPAEELPTYEGSLCSLMLERTL
jgi:hypothetical protein